MAAPTSTRSRCWMDCDIRQGLDVTLYGDPNNPDFKRLGFPVIAVPGASHAAAPCACGRPAAYRSCRSLRGRRRAAGADLFAGAAAYVKAVCLHAARSAATPLSAKLFALSAALAAPDLHPRLRARTAHHLRIRICESGYHPLLRRRRRAHRRDPGAAAREFPVGTRRGAVAGGADPAASAATLPVLSGAFLAAQEPHAPDRGVSRCFAARFPILDSC